MINNMHRIAFEIIFKNLNLMINHFQFHVNENVMGYQELGKRFKK